MHGVNWTAVLITLIAGVTAVSVTRYVTGAWKNSFEDDEKTEE